MRVYLGQTRSEALIAELNRFGFGECTLCGGLPPRRVPFFLDNGAYRDHVHQQPFRAVRFLRDQWRIRNMVRVEGHPPPDFIILPDVVAGGLESLALSLSWLFDPIVEWMAPTYLAVQNGMTETHIARLLDEQPEEPLPNETHPRRIDGLFVGGSLEWKVATGASWVKLAHERHLPCHIGRVGAVDRVEWAIAIGADSIDTCVPLWSRENLARFLVALGLVETPKRQLALAFTP